MASFSQRKGLKPLHRLVQIDAIDEPLRNRLWNGLYSYVLVHAIDTDRPYDTYTTDALTAQGFARKVWCEFLKRRGDEAPSAMDCERPIKQWFEAAEWNDVYELLEFSVQTLPPVVAEPLAKRWNQVLEEENAGYRIVGGEVVDVTSAEEITEIEGALSCGILAVREHIRSAVSLLSERKKPNYRNSIKESISAVESVCRLIGRGENSW